MLDLAEAYGLEISAERKSQVESASHAEILQLRLALKSTRTWP